jgi:hypothetical protein
MEFDGTIDSCDAASGTAIVTMENHAVGCKQLAAGDCSSGQTDTLDNNMPQFTVHGGVFELVRLDAATDCAAVVAALP